MSECRSPVVSLSRVEKRYRGRSALAGVDLELHAGSVTGLIGPNGAGKSTLLGVLGGFTRPTAGSGQVLGRQLANRVSAWPMVGVMAERPAFIEHLDGRTNLRMLASIRGILSDEEVDSSLREVGLDPKDRKPTRVYSQGMRQRLSLAQAVMESPRLLLLDEPTNGLDPHGIVLLRSTLRRLAAEGCAIVFASHLLQEVAGVSDRIILVHEGRFQAEHSPGDAQALESAYLSRVVEARP